MISDKRIQIKYLARKVNASFGFIYHFTFLRDRTTDNINIQRQTKINRSEIFTISPIIYQITIYHLQGEISIYLPSCHWFHIQIALSASCQCHATWTSSSKKLSKIKPRIGSLLRSTYVIFITNAREKRDSLIDVSMLLEMLTSYENVSAGLAKNDFCFESK